MSKFYIVGLTEKEVGMGKGLQLITAYSALLKDQKLLLSEIGNTLAYNLNCFDNDLIKDYGNYFEIDFIKDSIIDLVKTKIAVTILGIIDECDIPKNATKDFILG